MAFNPLKAIGKVFNDFPIIGDAIGAATDIFGQSSANKQNKKMAREQMAFQERMSSTEIQRRNADLAAAGMNPMLAYSQGGASSAQGAKAEMESVTGKAVHSALAMRMQRATLDNMEMQNRLLQAQRGNVEADTNLKGVTAQQTAVGSQKLESELYTLAQQFKNMVQQHELTAEDIKQKRLTNKQLEDMQPLLVQAQRLANQVAASGLPKAEAEAEFYKAMGATGIALQQAGAAGGLAKTIQNIWKSATRKGPR